MTSVDVFGSSMKKTTSVLKILSNGGLNSINDFVSVKIDPNTENILSLSANGLMANGIRSVDAATKNYVDIRRVKNNCGFIPELYSNSSKQGFIVTASSELNHRYQGWNVFNSRNIEWATSEVRMSAYLDIELPFPVAIWGFALRGRQSNTERWFKWAIEGSNDQEIWMNLYVALEDYIGNKTKFYTLKRVSEKYLYYRFEGVIGEPTNPGLSYMQLYSVDDLL